VGIRRGGGWGCGILGVLAGGFGSGGPIPGARALPDAVDRFKVRSACCRAGEDLNIGLDGCRD